MTILIFLVSVIGCNKDEELNTTYIINYWVVSKVNEKPIIDVTKFALDIKDGGAYERTPQTAHWRNKR